MTNATAKTLRWAIKLTRQGRREQRQANFGTALALYRKALRYHQEPATHFKIGICLERLGDPQAIDAYAQAAALAPDVPGYGAACGLALLSAGRAAEADAYLTAAWRRGPDGTWCLAMGHAAWWPADPDDPFLTAALPLQEMAAAVPTFAVGEQILATMRRLDDHPAASDERFWLFLAARLMNRGHAYPAYVAKTIAARRTMQRFADGPPDSQADLDHLVAACGYIARFDEGHAIIDRFETAFGTGWPTLRLRINLLFRDGRTAAAQELMRAGPLAADDGPTSQFDDLIRDRSCAVVGPATNSLRNGPEIDAHDLVIRTNFFDAGTISSSADMIGARTSISYFNSAQFFPKKEKVVNFIDNPIDFAVSRRHAIGLFFNQTAPDQKTRRWLSFKQESFIGIGLAMRHILFDLLLFRPGRVDVYGADFFLSDQPYYPGYDDIALDIARIHARHDPFDTFMLMKALHDAGSIGCDQVLSTILADDIHVFAHKLARRCGVR